MFVPVSTVKHIQIQICILYSIVTLSTYKILDVFKIYIFFQKFKVTFLQKIDFVKLNAYWGFGYGPDPSIFLGHFRS